MRHFFRFTATAVLVTIFLPSNVFSQDYDVRKAYCGMAPDDVIGAERRLPDHQMNRGGYFQQWYFTRSARTRWAPITYQWRYFFKRHKLAKVSYHTSFLGNHEEEYDKALKQFTEIYNQKAKARHTQHWRNHPWRKDSRTLVRISMTKEPTSGKGHYDYELTFYDAKYKK